jgi:hypothetical protein
MYRRISLRIFCIVCGLLVTTGLHAGVPGDSTFKLVAYVGGGLSRYISVAGTPSGMSTDVSKTGPAATVRVMWRPEHLLSVGLETGWTKLYSYKSTSGPPAQVYYSQVPLYLVWCMRFWEELNIFGGYGYSRVNTNMDFEGNVNIGTWSMGWVAACSYEQPLSKTMGIAAELKYINAVESQDGAITLQVHFVWNFYEW